MTNNQYTAQRGFTLLEVLLVLAVGLGEEGEQVVEEVALSCFGLADDRQDGAL